jgi:integral membrane sensor domain MASE1
MSTYISRVYNRFYPSSLISKARDIFYGSKRVFDYLRKLVQQQGVSFVVGIAVGVNLVLLLQISEDIHDKLSETLTGSVIAIAAIVSIVIVGVTIVYKQKKMDRRLRTLIEQQNERSENGNNQKAKRS